MEIKHYNVDYQQQVVDLILSIQQQEYGIAITAEDQPDLFTIESFYQQGKGLFLVALLEEEVVGTISLKDIGNNEVALRKMFVKEPYRGKVYKTATLLLQAAIEHAREVHVQQIYLGTVPEFKAAHRFYEKNGFTQIEMDQLPATFPLVKVDKLFYTLRLA